MSWIPSVLTFWMNLSPASSLYLFASNEAGAYFDSQKTSLVYEK